MDGHVRGLPERAQIAGRHKRERAIQPAFVGVYRYNHYSEHMTSIVIQSASAMDYQRPVEALIPGAQGKILGVLTRTEHELTIRQLAKLAGVGPTWATATVSNLVRLGLVERREAGAAALIRLARGSEAGQLLLAVARLHDRVLQRLRAEASKINPPPASLIIFGSFARAQARAESDIDVCAIRPRGVPESDDAWMASLNRWADTASESAGNPVNLLVVAEDEVPELMAEQQSVWASIAKEGIALAGAKLQDLAA